MAAGGQTSIAPSASCPEGLRQQLYITGRVAQHGIALVVGIANQQHVQRQLAVLCLGSQGMQTAQAASSQQPEAAKLLQVLAAGGACARGASCCRWRPSHQGFPEGVVRRRLPSQFLLGSRWCHKSRHAPSAVGDRPLTARQPVRPEALWLRAGPSAAFAAGWPVSGR